MNINSDSEASMITISYDDILDPEFKYDLRKFVLHKSIKGNFGELKLPNSKKLLKNKPKISHIKKNQKKEEESLIQISKCKEGNKIAKKSTGLISKSLMNQ